MAASLRTGVSWLLRSCQSWTQVAALRVTDKSFSNISSCSIRSILSSFSSRSFGSLSPALQLQSWNFNIHKPVITTTYTCGHLQPSSPLVEQIRTKVRYSREKGKPKTVHSVHERFYRLNWGAWIRTRAGRAKRLWKKNPTRKYHLRQHVFCNKQQSKLLDKMVTNYWKRPKYWVDDPYEPYHKRENFPQYFPERKRPFYP